jgi:hypothetical protein
LEALRIFAVTLNKKLAQIERVRPLKILLALNIVKIVALAFKAGAECDN